MNDSRTISAGSRTDLATFTILSDGKQVPRTYQVVSITVTQEINRITSARVMIVDGEAAKETFPVSDTAEFVPGKKITIKAGYSSNEQTIFNGVVISHSIKVRKHCSFLIVDCRDLSVKMTCGINNKIYFKQKDSEIFEYLIQKHGLKSNVEKTGFQHPEVVQSDMTDWDFMVSRAELNGKIIISDNGTIIIKSPDPSLKPVLNVVFGSSLLELDADIDARHQLKKVKAVGWDQQNQSVCEAESHEPALIKQGNISEGDLAGVMGLEEYSLFFPGTVPKTLLTSWADSRLLKSRMAKIRGRAKLQGTEKVKPGTTIELQGVGKRFAGNAFISGIRHQIAEGNWETDIQMGMEPEWFGEINSLSGKGFSRIFSSINGLQCGVVTTIENDPEGEYRIRISLPAMKTDPQGIWARVSSPDAGDNSGVLFRPEIGDEVVVGFIGNDASKPVVLGAMHSSARPAPLECKDTNYEKGFYMRSGIKWTIDEEKKIISFSTPAGNKIIMSDEDKGISIKDQNGNSIVMNENGIQLEISKDLKVTVNGKSEVSSMSLGLQSQSGFEVRDSASVKLQSSGTTEISGSLVKIN